MPIIETHNLQPGDHPLLQRAIYNALDCCVTLEVFEALRPLQGNKDTITYNFERALQAPILEMMLRGFRIDEYQRQRGCASLRAELEVLGSILNDFACAVWGRGLNPQSPKQLIDFFYKHMKLPEIWISQKGVRRISTNREALEKLDVYFHARPIIACILAIRDRKKQLSVLETEVSSDGRMRTSYNIAGTESGRLSSSGAADGTGTNLQNIAPGLRGMFIADEGWKLCGIDLEQAESREVGWQCGTLFGDWSYLNAAYSGDLHTTVCKMTWEKLPWTGDNKKDKAIAEQPFYREYTYRDMAKKLGHGCLTLDHQVLTPEGWVAIATQPEKIMCWDPKFGKSKFLTVSHWTTKEWEGEMVKMDATGLSLHATSDHRVLHSKDGAKGKIHECPAGNMAKAGAIPLGGGYVGGTYNLTPQEARLIAAFQCDGHRETDSCIAFHFHKERKFERLATLCDDANISYVTHGDKIRLKGEALFWWPKDAGSYLLSWSQDAILAYIEEHKHWDGHVSATAQCVFSSNREHLEWIQTTGRLVGIGGNFQKEGISGFGTRMHKLQQNNRGFASIRTMKVSKYQPETPVQVICPTVPTGAFYVRRKGKISITGNSNYYGAPYTMARHAKIPVQLATSFQENYFAAFPGIQKWHRWVAQQLQTTQKLVTPFGRERHFFGRPGDDSTLREAIAFVPQSSTADRTNLVLYRIWKTFGTRVQLLAQVHDAVYFQYRDGDDEQELLTACLDLFNIHMVCGEHKLIVPGECKIGWNWASASKSNPDGLVKWKPGFIDPRKRTTILNRTL